MLNQAYNQNNISKRGEGAVMVRPWTYMVRQSLFNSMMILPWLGSQHVVMWRRLVQLGFLTKSSGSILTN